MGARQKLNAHHASGGLILAALVGWLAQSWAAFVLALAALLALAAYAGDIRPAGRGRNRRRVANHSPNGGDA